MARRKRKFVEADHPRRLKGTEGGGRFRDKAGPTLPAAGSFIGNVPSTHGNARPQQEAWAKRISSSIGQSRGEDDDGGDEDNGLGQDRDLTDVSSMRRYYDNNGNEFRTSRQVVSPDDADRFYNDGDAGRRRRERDSGIWGHYIGETVQTPEGSGKIVGLYHNREYEEMVAVHYGEVEFDWAGDFGDLSILDWLADDAETLDDAEFDEDGFTRDSQRRPMPTEEMYWA